jgi:hypothetical protein
MNMLLNMTSVQQQEVQVVGNNIEYKIKAPDDVIITLIGNRMNNPEVSVHNGEFNQEGQTYIEYKEGENLFIIEFDRKTKTMNQFLVESNKKKLVSIEKNIKNLKLDFSNKSLSELADKLSHTEGDFFEQRKIVEDCVEGEWQCGEFTVIKSFVEEKTEHKIKAPNDVIITLIGKSSDSPEVLVLNGEFCEKDYTRITYSEGGETCCIDFNKQTKTMNEFEVWNASCAPVPLIQENIKKFKLDFSNKSLSELVNKLNAAKDLEQRKKMLEDFVDQSSWPLISWPLISVIVCGVCLVVWLVRNFNFNEHTKQNDEIKENIK